MIRGKIKKFAICLAVFLIACGQSATELQTISKKNGTFEVRATAFRENRVFGQALAGADYVFEVRRSGGDWRRIIDFHHDDQVAIQEQQIGFVNGQIGFVFMGWLYAVTTDAGESWHIWNANDTDVFGAERVGYDGIKSVKIEESGKGKMLLNVFGRPNPLELQTSDFGVTWANSAEDAVSNPNSAPVPSAAVSPSVTDSLSAIAKFREQPMVFERLNQIFLTNETDARAKAANVLSVSETNASNLVVCDDGLSWRVIGPTKLKEVRVSKDKNGVEPTVISLTTAPIETSRPPSPVNRDEAIAIAAEYFLRDTHQRFNADVKLIDGYFPSACAVGDYWRILFIPRAFENIKRRTDIASLPYDHPPNYLIDIRTGNVVFAQ